MYVIRNVARTLRLFEVDLILSSKVRQALPFTTVDITLHTS